MIKALAAFGFGGLGLTTEDFVVADNVVQLGYPPNRIDIISGIDGVSFADAFSDRVIAELDGLPVSFISKPLLIQNKRAAARDQDIADLNNLQ